MSHQQTKKAAVMMEVQRDQEMVFCTDGELFSAQVLRFFNFLVSEIDFILVHPGVKKLELNGCSWNLMTDIPQQNRSRVRKIDLFGCSINEKGFKDILTRFSELKELVYCRPLDEIDTHFDMIGYVLEEYGHHLEHLKMHNESLLPFCTPVGPLQACMNLKTLDMHLELLIGFLENPRDGQDEYMDAGFDDEEEDAPNYDEIYAQVKDWSLVEVLPNSLEKLTLWVEEPKLATYYNTYERYGAKFEELLTSDRRFPKLRSVTAPKLELVAEKLHGRLTGWILDGFTMARIPTVEEAEVAAAAVSRVLDVEPMAI
ncbi:hypothetical protein HD806DRAFT_212543 [Xylariaceae sp. AK1471]|nr:hypothetical protein HD806DRAFT_212543 [Xylariaceae sp. AK1471]